MVIVIWTSSVSGYVWKTHSR